MRRAFAVTVAVIVLAALLVTLSGCSLQLGLDTTVLADGSGTIGVKLAADKALQDALQQAGEGLGDIGSFFDGLREKIPADVGLLFIMILGNIPTDWSVSQGTDDDGTKWMSASRPFDDPEHLKDILEDGVLSSFVDADKFLLSQDKGFFSTKTVFSTTADASDALAQVQETDSSLPEELLSEILTIENRVTLPGTIKDNNADSVYGRTLVWQVGTSGTREMYAESVMYDWATIIWVAAAAFVVLVILLVVVILLIRRGRRRRAPVAAPRPPAVVQTAGAVSPAAAGAPSVDPPPPVNEYSLASAADDGPTPEETAGPGSIDQDRRV